MPGGSADASGPESCDGADNDCSGAPDADEVDGDTDGVMLCAGDCDDGDPNNYPGNPEVCDGADNDCDGVPETDEIDGDSDGVMLCAGDCDDGDPDRFPGNPEICDGVDNDCDGQKDEELLGCDLVILKSGWNLISVKLQPNDTTIGEVLGSVSDSCNSVWAFDGGWMAYYPAYPEYSDLQTMQAGWGYWLNMSEPATLTVSGSTPANEISLVEGWNLVGYNGADPLPIDQAIGSITTNCESVWAYINGSWKAYYPGNPEHSDLHTMEPHYGYWVKTSGDCIWTLP
jgi:hypothetical protein